MLCVREFGLCISLQFHLLPPSLALGTEHGVHQSTSHVLAGSSSFLLAGQSSDRVSYGLDDDRFSCRLVEIPCAELWRGVWGGLCFAFEAAFR